MDTQRLVLFIALSFVSLLLWEAWHKDYPSPLPTTIPASSASETPAATDTSVPTVNSSATPDAPPPALPSTETIATNTPQWLDSAAEITVETDVLRLSINTIGGDIRRAELLQYPVAIQSPEQPFELLSERSSRIFIAQSGLLATQGVAPDHYARYHSDKTSYRLNEGEKQLSVTLTWEQSGLQVIKTYTLERGSHRLQLQHQVINNRDSEWQGREYRQIQRSKVGAPSAFGIYTYTGGVVYSPEEKYEKIDFDDLGAGKLNRDIQGGWAAMIEHYFLGAWIPNPNEMSHYYSKAVGNERYLIGLYSPAVKVGVGKSQTFSSQLYLGPKLQDDLAQIAPGLELTVDYGVFTIFAQPLFWLLQWIHQVIGNWGWAIVVLTLLIKLVFYKLSETSYRSMAHMRRIHPRLMALKERYGDDRTKLNQAMMELYKKEKINPLGGCLPILVQIPVFIALYWMLLESVELRQAPFIFWIQDLATKDPYYVLPLIMGATMVIQQKLNPAPIDPLQQKVMMMMPIVFTVFFAFFPAGLVLYWSVNNTLSILQQWIITKRIAG